MVTFASVFMSVTHVLLCLGLLPHSVEVGALLPSGLPPFYFVDTDGHFAERY